MKPIIGFVLLFWILMIGCGFLLASSWYFISLGRSQTEQIIRGELSQLRDSLPEPEEIFPRVDYPAGTEEAQWRLIVSYRVQDYMDACKLERKIRGMMEGSK